MLTVHDQFAFLQFDHEPGTVDNGTADQGPGNPRFGFVLQKALERPGTKDERADRFLRILAPGACADHRIRDQPHRLVLGHDPPVQNILHPQPLLPLALYQPLHGYAGPTRDDLGDFFAQQALPAVERLAPFGLQQPPFPLHYCDWDDSVGPKGVKPG